MTGFDDLGYARPDTGREARLGLPEVVYGPGKTVEQIVGVVRSLLAGNEGPVLVSRIAAENAADVGAAVEGGSYDPVARLLVWRPAAPRPFRVVVASAGNDALSLPHTPATPTSRTSSTCSPIAVATAAASAATGQSDVPADATTTRNGRGGAGRQTSSRATGS